MNPVFSAATVLEGLKDFQRRTVDYAFARMFSDDHRSRRFLVADEVGLGKTLVAKGLIAKTVEHLWDKADRIDVIYVCSNADIAAQNVARLMIPGQPAYAKATRLTLLPLVTQELRAHRVNFISFTPGTTFNQGHRSGRRDERILIYQMLRELQHVDEKGLLSAMKGAVKDWDRWSSDATNELGFDPDIAQAFREQVAADETLLTEIQAVAEAYRDRRRKVSDADQSRCLAMVGHLRRRLAKVCLGALQPDLVILDEFQRFSDLLDDPQSNPSAELAHELFNYSEDLRVLLLSATPYKMYSRDDDEENHYRDFLRTVGFLMPASGAELGRLKEDIRLYRTGLLAARSEADMDVLAGAKARIEGLLTRVMCRTERVGSTLRADAMVQERLMVPSLQAADLREFRALDAMSRRLDEPEPIEYWKSSPYLLNFMRDYDFKRAIREDQKRASSAIADLLEDGDLSLVHSKSIERYDALDPANPRVRALMSEIDADGLWRLLWMPPSLPYWQPRGVYGAARRVSKHLVFSAWNVVPDALAAMLSFEVERRLAKQTGGRTTYSAMPKRFAARLRFSGHRDGRLRGMSALMLMFPSRSLVELVDPIQLSIADGEPQLYEVVRQRAAALLRPLVERFVDRSVQEGPFDRRWYWVALARLEASRHPDSRIWCRFGWPSAGPTSEHDDAHQASGFSAHVELWLQVCESTPESMGRVPHDLAEVLADIALAGPATCALRSLSRLCTEGRDLPLPVLTAAARVAEGLRSQFNSPRAVALLKATEDEEDSYWQQVLQYSADGNLQALLDEYAHVLRESVGLSSVEPAETAARIADAMFEAMSLRAATLRPEEVSLDEDRRLRVQPLEPGMRTHFAVRFGAQDDEEGAVARKEVVQAAFNSPFWPFVLASTSVGQEGLDFHTWCHSVVHWNLPSNPVDMEQREGRVHRYKGYAVRKNVALRYGARLRANGGTHSDPWTALFELAVQDRQKGSNDLAPYWICETEGGASIERRILALPLSRDEARYRRLRRSIALYRMVFAQPRQEDLLACLEQTVGEDQALEAAQRWRICLAPADPMKVAVFAIPAEDPTNDGHGEGIQLNRS